ncbi:uncharacterized protein LOC118160070 [Oxyura jamaicensis]|uniref:uncharacterized protein LOC118160070 n=1 Tax=Oxyura jamaicensis TaxID=8884 RepID=UPI0015A542ED|nr:uncharacterized protein LOC118160070 [Oxyura jamaicensis]
MPRVPSPPASSPDWQATRELRDTSLEQAAERGRFSQEARAWEQSLEQARRELAQARAELQRAWREGNSSLLELGRQEAELARVSGALASAERELQGVQGRLQAGQRAASSLRACLDADCCPPGLAAVPRHVPLRLVGEEELVAKPRRLPGEVLPAAGARRAAGAAGTGAALGRGRPRCLPPPAPCPSCCSAAPAPPGTGQALTASLPQPFLHAGGTKYWVEEQISIATGSVVRQDGVPYDMHTYSDKCSLSAAKGIERSACRRLHQWICEQPPRLSSMSKALASFLDEE